MPGGDQEGGGLNQGPNPYGNFFNTSGKGGSSKGGGGAQGSPPWTEAVQNSQQPSANSFVEVLKVLLTGIGGSGGQGNGGSNFSKFVASTIKPAVPSARPLKSSIGNTASSSFSKAVPKPTAKSSITSLISEEDNNKLGG